MPDQPAAKPTKQLYQLLADDTDGRACKDIPDEVCTALPNNYLLLLCSQCCTALADLLANPKTILTWLLTSLGTPASFIAWLVPLRESGSMLPQLMIGAYVRRFAKRKAFLVLGSVLQASSLLGMALVALWLEGRQAGVAILILLACFSLARGLNSVAQKDVLGKTVPKGRRGRLSGLATSVSGVITAIISLWLLQQDSHHSWFYAGFLLAAALLWFGASALFSAIREQAGASDGGVNAMQAAWQNVRKLKTDKVLRNFIICRGLLLSSALVQPFVVLLAQQQNNSHQTLMLLLLASSVAGAVSASLWGKAADRSSKQVLQLAAVFTMLGCVLPIVYLPAAENSWFYPLLFVWLNISHAGVRLGRKTYLVDIATGNQRTEYVALSNSLMGVLLLLVGAIAALFAAWSVTAVLCFFALLSLVAICFTFRLSAT
ncbi:MAG: MFS transporter [Alishewanella sp.]|uniref:MFS transporter n=1 Tax=Alishewanella sp. HL-SH05 TaxID=3461145 RepID=UPI002775CF2B|nr:MFS transporter [Alishewanella sp.]MDP5035736.1 MFS transporter [Alishewanella sp.]MDP5186864.1 MFS transporter [Alishewanella sp.]